MTWTVIFTLLGSTQVKAASTHVGKIEPSFADLSSNFSTSEYRHVKNEILITCWCLDVAVKTAIFNLLNKRTVYQDKLLSSIYWNLWSFCIIMLIIILLFLFMKLKTVTILFCPSTGLKDPVYIIANITSLLLWTNFRF